MMRFAALALVGAATVAHAANVPGKAFDRFFTIWLENQDYTKVADDGDMKEIAKQGILLTEYFAHTHPSQPNYIASVGGDYFGLNHDDFVQIPANVSTVVDLLDTRHIEWRGYFEDIPGPGYMGPGTKLPDGSGWDYVRKHNPFISYDSVTRNGTRLLNIQSLRDFETDVKKETLPQYAHISPNMLNDGHDTGLKYATNWSRTYLKDLLDNKKFMEKTLVLLTYDESEDYSKPNQIVSVLLGGAVPDNLKGTKDDTLYTHYSILSTLENNWELPNLGRYDVGANVFKLVAEKTGWKNHAKDDPASVNNSVSYDGFLNWNPSKQRPIPPPNLKLVGAGGKGVADIVKKEWKLAEQDQTPYDGSGHLYDGGNGKDDSNAPVYKSPAPNNAK